MFLTDENEAPLCFLLGGGLLWVFAESQEAEHDALYEEGQEDISGWDSVCVINLESFRHFIS